LEQSAGEVFVRFSQSVQGSDDVFTVADRNDLLVSLSEINKLRLFRRHLLLDTSATLNGKIAILGKLRFQNFEKRSSDNLTGFKGVGRRLVDQIPTNCLEL